MNEPADLKWGKLLELTNISSNTSEVPNAFYYKVMGLSRRIHTSIKQQKIISTQLKQQHSNMYLLLL
jgi:hypothetical protein